VIFSLPGFIWAVTFYWWFRDDPMTHPSVNSGERAVIAAGTVIHDQATHPPIPWRIVFTTPQIWLMGGILMCSAFNSYLYFSWYPTYLEEGRGVKSIESGYLSSIVLTGGAIGCICGGFLIDFLIKLTGQPHKSRRWWGFMALSLSAVCLITGRFSDSAFVSALWTSGSVLFVMSSLSCWWGAVTDLSGRHLGALFGLMNSLGGIGAISSQLFIGPYTKWMESFGYVGRAQWDSIFYVYSGVLLIGATGWLFVDSSQSVDRPEDAAVVH